MASLSFSGVFFPMPYTIWASSTPWPLSGAFLALAPTWTLWLQWRRVFTQSRPRRVTVVGGYNPALAVAITLISLAAFLLFLGSAIGLQGPDGAFGLYLAAVLLLLLNAAVNFLRLVVTAFGEDETAA